MKEANDTDLDPHESVITHVGFVGGNLLIVFKSGTHTCRTTPFTGINRMPHQTNNHIKYCYHMIKQSIGCPPMCNWCPKSINVL